jgi:hypothetical protein
MFTWAEKTETKKSNAKDMVSMKHATHSQVYARSAPIVNMKHERSVVVAGVSMDQNRCMCITLIICVSVMGIFSAFGFVWSL